MGDVIDFRMKRLTGFLPEQPDGNSKDKQNRAFWKGSPDDTAPSEMTFHPAGTEDLHGVPYADEDDGA